MLSLVLGGCSACITNDPASLKYRDAATEDVTPEDVLDEPDAVEDLLDLIDLIVLDDPDDEETEDAEPPDLDEPEAPPPEFTRFVTIRVEPSTTFTMGVPTTDPCYSDGDGEHEVTLTHDFEIMENEVRQDEYEFLMGDNPSYLDGPGWRDRPVENLDWHKAAEFANALSDREGYSRCYSCPSGVCSLGPFASPYDCNGYRLPTEAEWEYAARAGTTTANYNGDCDAGHLYCTMEPIEPCEDLVPIAWYQCTSFRVEKTYEVKTKDANDFLLYDMLGNVQEWCHDWYEDYSGDITNPWGPTSGPERVTRGGSWYDDACVTSSAVRSSYADTTESLMIGFRLVRSL